ncbi:unnamed protein product [Caenorhabditis angaria]|uniref:Uncharacterized protein n=1 Tax=Caenorhabditis angaria TaxID=860376 RepID=A0A9P1IL74_9PELO|nr:unnamed protein product [Caenorhabditis angaria]
MKTLLVLFFILINFGLESSSKPTSTTILPKPKAETVISCPWQRNGEVCPIKEAGHKCPFCEMQKKLASSTLAPTL